VRNNRSGVTPGPLRRLAHFILLTTIAFPLSAARQLGAQVPTPEAHLGFRMGATGRLATADGIENYFETVASQSNRVRVVDLGVTTEGHRTIAAIVSAPENIRNLDRS
jgi:hypothetical protein